MEVIRSIENMQPLESSVVTIGNYDGIHLGHQDILKHIIETAKIKKHAGKENDVYECVFMVMKKGGFSYGFSVVASFEVKGDTMKLVSLRTQPIDIEQPGDVKAFTDGAPGKEFLKFELVKEAATPTMGEFEEAKNKLM